MLDWVNTLQGTDSDYKLSHGGTLPVVGPPWPMTHWAPQTQYAGAYFEAGGWWFQSTGNKVYGLRATHQPSPWMGDYGQFSVMPQTGPLQSDPNGRASDYDRNVATFKPDYIKLHLSRYDVDAELTASERCGVMRFTFASGDTGRLIFDPARVAHVEIDGRTIRGYTTANSGGVPENWKAYFVARLDRDCMAFGTVDANGNTDAGAKAIDGDRIAAYVEFATAPAREVSLTIATSFIGYAQAEITLAREASDGFDAVRARTAEVWESNLSRVRISGATDAQRRTFYSCLFRAQTFPHKAHELNAQGKPVHFSVFDGQIHDGVAYTDIGFWDVYRTNFPLWSILFPDQLREILAGFVGQLSESDGWFPQWPSPGHRVSMIGTHVDAVFADALAKQIGGFDAEAAYAGLRKNAFETPPTDLVGRMGFDSYEKLGYVAAGTEAGYSASCSLDYAYNDWCVAQVAKALGKTDDYQRLSARTKNYEKLWDPAVGFFRPKNADGSWFGDFDEFAWSTGFVEGSAWQCGWAVQHDVDGLAALIGGHKAMGEKLDRMMGLPPVFHVGEYKNVIHEMTEMAIVPFGQYAHSNQPVHHVLYLFAAIGQPAKTQYWTRRVCQELYDSGPQGFCGDEDNGEMSAWYILSALGLYQTCVGEPTYTLTAPLFDRAEIDLPDGKRLTVRATHNAPTHPYVQSRTLDGRPFDGEMLSHARLMQGGDLNVDLGPQPPHGAAAGD